MKFSFNIFRIKTIFLFLWYLLYYITYQPDQCQCTHTACAQTVYIPQSSQSHSSSIAPSQQRPDISPVSSSYNLLVVLPNLPIFVVSSARIDMIIRSWLILFRSNVLRGRGDWRLRRMDNLSGHFNQTIIVVRATFLARKEGGERAV